MQLDIVNDEVAFNCYMRAPVQCPFFSVFETELTPPEDCGAYRAALKQCADGKAFTERSAGDRHQFRFIVAPEDSAELSDLKPFVRDLIRQMEQDLGTKLDWVAADHFNTGNPHSHIVIRGRDDEGNDLVIARNYISHGMRARAADLITRELVPETTIEATRKLQQEVTAERFTRLDRTILLDAANGALELSAQPARDPEWHATRMGRLRTLERMGLAEETAPGRWQIDTELEARLRRLGERGDVIKTVHRELTAAGLSRAAGSYTIFNPEQGDQRLVGRVIGEGLSDELSDRRYVVIDGIDGRTHYVDLGALPANDEPLIRNTIVELSSRRAEPREIDPTIAKIAAALTASSCIGSSILRRHVNMSLPMYAGWRQCAVREW